MHSPLESLSIFPSQNAAKCDMVVASASGSRPPPSPPPHSQLSSCGVGALRAATLGLKRTATASRGVHIGHHPQQRSARPGLQASSTPSPSARGCQGARHAYCVAFGSGRPRCREACERADAGARSHTLRHRCPHIDRGRLAALPQGPSNASVRLWSMGRRDLRG